MLAKGKWAEKQVQDWLKLRSDGDAEFAFHRLPDAGAARNFLAAQPADLLVSWKGVGALMVEVKESKEVNRIPKAKISQYGALQRFSWAGMQTRVVIFLSSTNQWTYLDDTDLFCYEVCPASFPFKRKKYSSADEVLSTLFGGVDRIAQ